MNGSGSVTPTMIKAGQDIVENLTDAGIAYSMKGLGGGCVFDLWGYPEESRGLIDAWVKDKITSVEAIYIVMREQALKEL